MRRAFWFGLACAFSGSIGAAEVTIKNDSLTDFSTIAVVWGFGVDEMPASWLTSPCDGNLVAVQIFWRSQNGTSAATIANAIHIYRSGTFPEPGDLAQDIGGPVLNDNALNEWRYLDENNTLPLSVPVTANETLVVALEFAEAPQPPGPSVVRDTDGNTSGRNAMYANVGGTHVWIDSADIPIQGDWVIRGVVNCQAGSTNADVGVTMSANPAAYTAGSPLQYTIGVANAGPAVANAVTLVDIFPSAFQSPSWTCLASGGATCPAASGSGNITGATNLPANGQISFTVNGTVATGTTGTLGNSMTAVVNAPATDPNPANNTLTLNLDPASNDVIFKNGFDAGALRMIPVPARALGRR